MILGSEKENKRNVSTPKMGNKQLKNYTFGIKISGYPHGFTNHNSMRLLFKLN